MTTLSNLKATNDFYKIFIDLEKPTTNAPEARKFIFRVISKSQPWGTQKVSPDKKLESNQRSKALEIYNQKDPFETPLEKFWPYDATEPIPFAFFIQAKSIDELKNLISSWQKKIKFKSTKKSNDKYSLEEIWNYTQNILQVTELPAIYLNINNIVNISEDNNEQENANDEIENLFIRLNSAGTPLTGEELNYSILKSYISIELQQKIEEICFPMFTPSRFITIVFRLFQHTKNINLNDSYSLKIKPKQFQRNIKENQKEFTKFLTTIINDKRIKKLENLLCYSPENTIGLPTFITYKLASRAPEVMFILLYRLWIMKDSFDNEEYYKRMLACLTTLSWFGKNGNKNEHTKLLTNIKDFIKESKEKFWSKKMITLAAGKNKDNLLIPISPRKIEIPSKLFENSTFDNFTCYQKNEENYEFLSWMFFEKELILYAQKEYLFIAFSKYKQKLLYNTFIPYDWDHIFPYDWINNKKNIFYPTRTWYNTNGNFRAWSLSLNRHDQAEAPQDKLIIDKSEFEEDISKFSQQFQKIKYKKNILCEWSICGSEWLKIDYNNIKDKENAKKTLKFIMNRGIEIYKKWYNTLYISLK